MGPKKKEEEKKVHLGRPGNSLKSGIVCTESLAAPLGQWTDLSAGRPRQCWQIDALSGYHEMFPR
jgi:hypothetical protein